MKKSNALLTAGLILLLISIVLHNFRLTTEYKSGNYKNPYRNFVPLSFKDFDTIEILSSTAANAKLVQGPFSIRGEENAMDYIRIKQEGRRLIINAEFKYNYLYSPYPYTLIISCPNIKLLSTNAGYRSNGREVTDTIVREDWKMKQVLISGFTQDTLPILLDYGSTVLLDSNHINHVYARIGKSKRSGSNLLVRNTNHFNSASFYLENQSKLFLDSAIIGNIDYHLGDSTKLIINGRAINLLTNPKNTGK